MEIVLRLEQCEQKALRRVSLITSVLQDLEKYLPKNCPKTAPAFHFIVLEIASEVDFNESRLTFNFRLTLLRILALAEPAHVVPVKYFDISLPIGLRFQLILTEGSFWVSPILNPFLTLLPKRLPVRM